MRHGRLLPSLLVVATVAAGCGGGDDDDTVRPSTPPPTATTTTGATVAPTTTSTVPAAPRLDQVTLGLAVVTDDLDSPVSLAWRAGDDRMYVTEQHTGRVRAVEASGAVVDGPLLEIDVSTGNEQGLLGLAFSPDGSTLFVDYTDPDGDTHVDAYTMAGDVVDAASRRELLFVPQPFPNHNGGQLQIGPDGMLYVGLGDGGAAGDPEENAQDLASLLGKILRIDPAPTGGAPYGVPADNPFVTQAGARPEIWMYGLRNPWRFSFDRDTGDVWIADVGQNAYEEIDVAAAGDGSGANWGWHEREALHEFEGPLPDGARDPVLELAHADGNCSVTGGYVYRGSAIPDLRGAYVFADYCRGVVTAAVVRDGVLVEQRELGVQLDEVTSFGEDRDGELYVASRDGTLARLVAG